RAGAPRVEALVPGRPDWRLVASTSAATPLDPERVERAAWALAAWRAARLQQSRADARLRVRTRDPDAPPTLGRGGAEAKPPPGLFAAAAAALPGGAGIDLVGVAHTLEGAPAAALFPSRPVPGDALDLLLRRSGVALGWPIGHEPVLEQHALPGLE